MVSVKSSKIPGAQSVKHLLLHFKGLLIAVVALALSAGLAFAAQPPAAASWGLANAAAHAGKTVPHQVLGATSSEDEDVEGDEGAETDEETDEVPEVDEPAGEDAVGEETADAASDNCLTDPTTTLTPEELAAMNHGSIVCWAAHQKTWPEEFRNHGAWVSSWAHWGKGLDAAEAKVAKEKVAKEKVAKTKLKTKAPKNR